MPRTRQPESVGWIRTSSPAHRQPQAPVGVDTVGETAAAAAAALPLTSRLGVAGPLTRGDSRVLETLSSPGCADGSSRPCPLPVLWRGLARSVRIIEDLLRRTGMWVDFRFEGQEISLDCELARDLNNPLVHLFRNSLAHGIESPEERIAAGKPRHGTVALTIRSEDGRVVLEFADDGRGIDPERIRAAAVRRGLLTPEAAGALGPGECLNLVFVPGFSTSEQVGPLSGRGVGLDSVREDIRKLSGEVIIDRTHAPGTRFVISVPHQVA